MPVASGCALLLAVCIGAVPLPDQPAADGPESVLNDALLGRVSNDADADGLDDALEDRLAERFAPIVFHGERETTFPTNVDAWLARTELSVVNGSGSTTPVQSRPLRQTQLLGRVASLSGVRVSSSGTRSRGKWFSFVLDNVPTGDRAVLDPSEWVTYVHSYSNEMGGVTLQYWRAYTRNDAAFLGIELGHGGDWEAIAVHLEGNQHVRKTTYLDHSGIVDVTASAKWENGHPLVWSEEGGHSSYADPARVRSVRWFRHESWTGGRVTRWDSIPVGTSGGLLNIGEKTHPRNGQVFVQYSGLWGSRGRLFMTSGYWGPAFNETDAVCADGSSAYRSYLWRRAERGGCGRIFVRAWCDGMDGTRMNVQSQCYASSDVP
jgi:hypothetical protein